MHKLAVFVEGYTEMLFVERLILEVAGAHNVIIEQKEIRGGSKVSKVKRTMSVVKAAQPATGQKYYVLIVNCGGDHQVKTRILEEHENLTRKGYAKIIGMRDVRPDFTFEQVPLLEVGLRKYIKTSLIPVEFILAVMEIEAWFLAEFHHFSKIDPAITVSAIKARLGFDPELDDLALRPNPTVDLNAAYMIGGKRYEKNQIATTVDVLDYPYIFLELKNKIRYLQRLGDSIEQFLV